MQGSSSTAERKYPGEAAASSLLSSPAPTRILFTVDTTQPCPEATEALFSLHRRPRGPGQNAHVQHACPPGKDRKGAIARPLPVVWEQCRTLRARYSALDVSPLGALSGLERAVTDKGGERARMTQEVTDYRWRN